MDRAELERLLRAWGRAFGQRPPGEWEEDRSLYPTPLATAAEFAPGKKDKRTAHHRGGRSRRTLIGASAGLIKRVRGEDVVAAAPTWAADPIPASATRSPGGTWHPGEEAERVERAWLDMYSYERIPAIVLRVEYCTRGTQGEKLPTVEQILREPMKLRRYRLELDAGRLWMYGRLAPKRAA